MKKCGSVATSTGKLLPDLGEEWARYGVEGAWVFGSRARGICSPDSDWDFLVRFRSPVTFDAFMGLKTALEDKLGAPVDLLSESACKPRFLEAIREELIDAT